MAQVVVGSPWRQEPKWNLIWIKQGGFSKCYTCVLDGTASSIVSTSLKRALSIRAVELGLRMRSMWTKGEKACVVPISARLPKVSSTSTRNAHLLKDLHHCCSGVLVFPCFRRRHHTKERRSLRAMPMLALLRAVDFTPQPSQGPRVGRRVWNRREDPEMQKLEPTMFGKERSTDVPFWLLRLGEATLRLHF